MVAAYEALSPELRTLCDSLHAVHRNAIHAVRGEGSSKLRAHNAAPIAPARWGRRSLQSRQGRQNARFAAPALMAGNAGVLKHSANVPGCALALEQLFHDAGFPQHLFRTLLISSKAVDAVIEHPHIKAVSLTGSGPAGRAVAAKAGSLLKKTVLELGGADA